MLNDGPRIAFLYDGNHDGVYTRDYGDGLFIDVDGNESFTVDTMSPEFFPFSVPFQVGTQVLETDSVQVDGSWIRLRALGSAPPSTPPAFGEPAPEFSFNDLSGTTVHTSDYLGHPLVVYFWAGWCSSCDARAPQLRAMYDRYHTRGMRIVGISYDTDLTVLSTFLARHPAPWPTSFTGKQFWENQVGRLYRAGAAGAAYLIDADGNLDGYYPDLDELEQRIKEILP
jgi:thiol-disulfide isomerase/thioredoxin